MPNLYFELAAFLCSASESGFRVHVSLYSTHSFHQQLSMRERTISISILDQVPAPAELRSSSRGRGGDVCWLSFRWWNVPRGAFSGGLQLPVKTADGSPEPGAHPAETSGAEACVPWSVFVWFWWNLWHLRFFYQSGTKHSHFNLNHGVFLNLTE